MSLKEAEDFAEKHKMIYAETSAKDNMGVESMFRTLTDDIMKKVEKKIIDIRMEVC